MKIPDEFLAQALKREIDLVIIPAPLGKRVFSHLCGTTRITRESRLPGGKRYGIINVMGATYKKIKDLTDKDVNRAGHESMKAFLSWWGARESEYTPNDRVALIEFELVAIEKFGLRFLEGKEVDTDG